ncbi:MAG: serine/threonine-protein kinase, partial [Cyanobacteria bacterium P01_D01_bin.6]
MRANLIGQILDSRYKIEAVLGQGGMGCTYQAFDLEQNRPIAVKALSLHRAESWKAMELFERESNVLKQLDHPAIPKYLDYFEVDTDADRAFYLVQSLAPGRSLLQWIEAGWRPTESEVRAIAQQILKILDYLQEFTPAIIHRDLKPQNLIRQDDGQIFLVDFGAVQDVYRHTIGGGSTVVGTFGYMAPEQFRGEANLSTDLYGLGTTLLFLLTGQSPLDLPQRRLKIDVRKSVTVERNFAAWLDRLVSPDWHSRLPSA